MSASTFSTTIHRVTPDQVCTVLQGPLLGRSVRMFNSAKIDEVARAIAAGINAGTTTQELVRQVRGSRTAGYADAILPITTRAAETLVRTAISGAIHGFDNQAHDVIDRMLLDCSFAHLRNLQRQLGHEVRS